MSSQSELKGVVQKYLEGFNQRDADMLVSLFAEYARIEDPVGGQIVEGEEAIANFYQKGVKFVEKLELVAPIRGSHGRSAAMAFIIHMNLDGKQVQIHCIDVMTMNDSGKIVDMKAYWGPEDIVEC